MFPRPLETFITTKCADEVNYVLVRADVASIMCVQGRYKEAARIEECGTFVRKVCPSCGYRELRTYQLRCDLRECPECARMEAKRLFVRIMRTVKKIPLFPGWTWRHLVITSKRDNSKPMKDDYLKIKAGLRKLRAYFRKKEFSNRISAVGGIQFGPKNCMAHVHLAIFCKWLNLQEIKEVTGLGSCWIKVIKTSEQFYEAVRYGCNVSKVVDPVYLANCGLTFKGSRRLFTWGFLYGSTTPEKRVKVECKCPCCQVKMTHEHVYHPISAVPRSGLSPGFALC